VLTVVYFSGVWGVTLPGMKWLSIIIPSGGVTRGRFVGAGGLSRRPVVNYGWKRTFIYNCI
jgi:hypothetical protein